MTLTKEQIEATADSAPRYGLPSIRRDEVDELCRLALLGLERDERAEKIGKLVMDLWGTNPKPLRLSADHRTILGKASGDHFHTVRLLRGVADILEKP